MGAARSILDGESWQLTSKSVAGVRIVVEHVENLRRLPRDDRGRGRRWWRGEMRAEEHVRHVAHLVMRPGGRNDGAAFGGRRQRADHSRPDEYQYFFFVPLEARTEAIVWHAEKNLPARVDGDVDEEAGALC